MLSKLRHYVTRQPLIQLYYLLVYPFITYTILVWTNTYIFTLQSLILLQQKSYISYHFQV